MKNYLMPLWIFVGGQFLILILWLFLSAIGTAGDTLATNEHISTFWGMTWAAGSIRFIVIIAGELIVTIAALIAFLHAKT
jgi:hypothetical protein